MDPQYHYSAVRLCLAALVLACGCIGSALVGVMFADQIPFFAWICGAASILLGYGMAVLVLKAFWTKGPAIHLSREELVFDHGFTKKRVRYSDIRRASIHRDGASDDLSHVLDIELNAVREGSQVRRRIFSISLFFVAVNPAALLAEIKARMGVVG